MRSSLGLTQRDLGNLCDSTEGNIRRIEAGGGGMNVSTFKRLAVGLGMEYAALKQKLGADMPLTTQQASQPAPGRMGDDGKEGQVFIDIEFRTKELAMLEEMAKADGTTVPELIRSLLQKQFEILRNQNAPTFVRNAPASRTTAPAGEVRHITDKKAAK
jgi:transcriptional regulator with XRE-family HTH domain